MNLAKISIGKAFNIYKRRSQREQLIKEGRQATSLIPGNVQLIHGDFMEMSKTIRDNSIDLIFTDPPYGEKSLFVYKNLAITAERVLKPGGSVIFYCGTYAIPQILEYIKESGLNYYWIIAVKLKGSFARMWPKQVSVKWKPLIWCIKGQAKFNTTEYISDLVESTGSYKILHDWEQSVTDAHHVISRITLEGQVVLDLMMGSGTTGIAALQLNRKFIGIESDADTFAIARARIGRITDNNHETDNQSIRQSENREQIEINGDDIIEPSYIQDSELVRSLRESNAHMTHIAKWEEKDLWEQYFSEWDPY